MSLISLKTQKIKASILATPPKHSTIKIKRTLSEEVTVIRPSAKESLRFSRSLLESVQCPKLSFKLKGASVPARPVASGHTI